MKTESIVSGDTENSVDLTIIIGKEKHKAKEGEAFYYTPDKKHYITSKKGAEILWVSTPPSF